MKVSDLQINLLQRRLQTTWSQSSPCEIFIFPDGERRVRLEKCSDEDVIIVQTFSPHPIPHYGVIFSGDAAKEAVPITKQ